MVMTLVLGDWEALSLKSGCNLYSKKFRVCMLTVKKAHQNIQLDQNSTSSYSTSGVVGQSPSMYFRESDPPSAVDVDLFLATALPKLLLASLILFLNGLAIHGLIASSRALSSLNKVQSSTKGQGQGQGQGSSFKGSGSPYLFLPSSTQGLLHSLFAAYLALGLLTAYSQVGQRT